MTRSTVTVTTTTVEHVAKPLGKGRVNGPHLADLRAFVSECRGLPDDAVVSIRQSNLDESGRCDVTLSVRHRLSDEPQPVAVAEDVRPSTVEAGQRVMYRWPWAWVWQPGIVEHVCTEGPRTGTVAVRLERRRVVVIGVDPADLQPAGQ